MELEDRNFLKLLVEVHDTVVASATVIIRIKVVVVCQSERAIIKALAAISFSEEEC